MTDKNWMLNPSAIAQARSCIAIVQAELGIKLKLSHPQFLELIVDYIELTDSEELAIKYSALSSFADIPVPQKAVISNKKVTEIETPLTQAKAKPAPNKAEIEMVEHRGKQYPKFSEGGEFKGLYRGQARYA